MRASKKRVLLCVSVADALPAAGLCGAGTAFSVANPVDRQRYVMKRVPIVNLEMEAVHCSEARLHARVRHRHVVGYQYSWIEKDGDDRSLCILLER